MVHRGPDEQDVYESQSVSREPVQLKLVHLAAGKQPMRTENRNTILVSNGKIQNRQEPRWALDQALYIPSTAAVVRKWFCVSSEAWDVRSLLPALKGLRWSNTAGCCAYVGLQEKEHTGKSQCEPRVPLLVE
jgi:hypothetical protein